MGNRYKIAILGAGLAGLAAAVALARDGHEITVLESRSNLSEIGAGVQIPPNASRILSSWGLREQLGKKSTTSTGLYIKRYANGELLCRIKQGLQDGQDELPNWTIYRPDYQQILYDAAVRHGVVVKFGITIQDPRSLEADLVVLADGIGSKTRKYVLGSEEPSLRISKNAYRVIIPREDILNDPVTAELMTDGYQRLWAGPDRYIMSYPIAQGKFFNMVLIHPGTAAPGEWNRRGNVEEMRREFSDFEPVVGRLLEKAEGCMDWTLGRLPPLPKWSGDKGRVLLIGDAAHAMTPDYAQGAAMCVEDAAVLACCLARAGSVHEATTALEGLRKERTEKIQQAAWDNSIIFTLPDGAEQEKRDAMYTLRSDPEEGRSSVALDSAMAKFSAWVYGSDVIKEAIAFWEAKASESEMDAKL